MGNFVINLNGIKDDVIPILNNALTCLSEVSTNAATLNSNLPDDFEGKSSVLDIVSKIEMDIRTDIENILSFYQGKVTELETKQQQHSLGVDSIMGQIQASLDDVKKESQKDTKGNLSDVIQPIDMFKNGTTFGSLLNNEHDDTSSKTDESKIPFSEYKKNDYNAAISDPNFVNDLYNMIIVYGNDDNLSQKYTFSSTKEAETAYANLESDIIKIYKKYKKGEITDDEFVAFAKKYAGVSSGYDNYFCSNAYFNEQIEILEKENKEIDDEIGKHKVQNYSDLNGRYNVDEMSVAQKQIDECESLRNKKKSNNEKIDELNQLIALNNKNEITKSKAYGSISLWHMPTETLKNIIANKVENSNVSDKTKEEFNKLFASGIEYLGTDNDFCQYIYASLETNGVEATITLMQNDEKYYDVLFTDKVDDSYRAKVDYQHMNIFDKIGTNAKVFTGSFVEGAFDVAENIVDGGATIIAIGANELNFDTSGIEDFISTDWSGEWYDDFAKDLNPYAAYGSVHTVGNFAGSAAAYAALSLIPGGASVAKGAAGALAAMGSATDRALNSGATLGQALVSGSIAGGLGLGTGLVVEKVGIVAKGSPSLNKHISKILDKVGIPNGSTSLGQVAGFTAAGVVVSIIEPIVNSFAEYGLYANGMVDEEGNKLYSDIIDYYVNSGALTNIFVAGVAGGISVGSQGVSGYSNYKKVYDIINDNDNINPLDIKEQKELQKQLSGLGDSQKGSVLRNEDSFKNYGKLHGYTDETLEAYSKRLKLEAEWKTEEQRLKYKSLMEKVKNGESVTHKDYLDCGYTKRDWAILKKLDTEDLLDELEILADANITKITSENFLETLEDSAETLFVTNYFADEGAYEISADEVVKKRMDAKNGIYTPKKKIIINGKEYTQYFPGCDEFIKDDWLIGYTKKITKITDLDLENYASSIGLSYSGNELEVMAKYLEANPQKIKGTIYQSATNGAKNYKYFGGNLGNTQQIAGDYNISGGVYMLLSDDATMARNFGDCCKLDKNGKLVITNIEKFGKDALSGVSLSKVDGAYKFDVEISLNSQNVSMPSVNNGSMFTAYGVPGGQLLSGELETVISGTHIGLDFTESGKTYTDENGKTISSSLIKGNRWRFLK